MIDIEKYLDNFYKGTKNPSLDAMQYFMDEYNDFQRKMKFIHIAGTNGKGSCTEMINNILVNQGYKVGKFMSPHLIKYNERISINGNQISDEEMLNLIEELEPKIKNYNETRNVNVTLFELETTMALLYFYRNNVDFVILETGLGGLYDCTNIISKPLISIITSIGYDHMHILGDTLPEIAYQKAGIIKENSNTVLIEHSQEINEVFKNVCNSKENILHLIKKEEIKNYSYNNDFQYFDFKDLKKIKINLKGEKQIENAAICIEAINILNDLGYEVSEENMRKGLSTVIHKGRLEILKNDPLIIFDGAHNEPAINNFKNTVNMYYKDLKKVYVVSILKTKDFEEILKLLLEDKTATFILTSGNDDERYVSANELNNVALKYKSNEQTVIIKSLNEAIEFVMNSNRDVVNFIIGSFYVYETVFDKIKSLNCSCNY